MFLKDRRGSIAVIVAIALPALLVGIGGAVETSRAVTFRQRLWSAVELSCAQGAAYVNAQKPLDVKRGDTTKTYPDMIQTLAVRNFAAKNLPTITPKTTPASDVNVHVEATGSQNLVFSGLLNTLKIPFSASKDCAVISTTDALKANGSTPELLFSESFESNHSVASNSWTVLGGKNNSNAWNGWTTQAAGIEINGMPELAANTIRFGNFFAELDSDCGTAANTNNSSCKSNSTMSRIMNLTADEYEVRYWYIARLRDASRPGQVICGAKDSDVSWYTTEGQTNRIELYVEKSGNYTYSANNLVDVCVQADAWTERVYKFTVTTKSDYRFSWRAAGREDTYGGLIDYIRICRNSCP
ncbi:TadE/TadG family type IV pilus assembly protein [Methylobacterium trifolii]|uniref:Flp pilus-assembly TadG-like N-terminal domain-containing protein n=1 Tax=Methylobacterium trifolii TaxID=1003092 RepID=A0ABQ4U0P2_9HYPH|nr:TadE/TadG family type IV pilus assembly protein [Methylobacterium trifolii]GJE59858.1 hypothetical protein MPOCJGCO_1960 [Methylobacterium trifolii]